MRTLTMKTFATGIVAAALLFTSCKKGDKGDQGPAGMNGQNGVVPTSTDGFIKGTLSGTREDGTAFSETFEFKNYWGGPSGSLDSNSAVSYDFIIRRGTDYFGENAATITVNTNSKTATSGSISLDNFSFVKSLGTNQRFEFRTFGTPSATVTGLSYNQSSGKFTGNFTFSVAGFQNTTGNAATISGSFEATMTQLYNFIKNTAPESLETEGSLAK